MDTSGLLVAAEGSGGFWIPTDFNEVTWNSTALDGADDEANQILDEAREAATRIISDLEQRTVTDIANVRAAHEAEIIELLARAEADLSADLAALSLGSAEFVVQWSLDGAAQQRLIDNYIDGIRAN